MTSVKRSGSGENYRAAGVDLDAGEEAVRRIGPLVRGTYRPEVMGDIGGFGGVKPDFTKGLNRLKLGTIQWEQFS